MIKLKNVVKRYSRAVALDNVSMQFEKGHIYGLLGNNGAGKSTIVKMIGNLITYSEGQITYDSKPLFENETAMRNIAIAGDYCNYFPDKKIIKLFKDALFFNKNFDLDYAVSLSDKFEMDVNKKLSALSTGYVTIFKFILAVASGKEFIFLDEPVLGLDAINRQKIYEVILEAFGKNECSIIISTHLIDEISNLIDRIIFIKYGKILFDGDKDELLKRVYVAKGKCEDVNAFVSGKKVISKSNFNGVMTCYFYGDIYDKNDYEITLGKSTLQNIFINVCR